jgi:hypothetical protein
MRDRYQREVADDGPARLAHLAGSGCVVAARGWPSSPGVVIRFPIQWSCACGHVDS